MSDFTLNPIKKYLCNEKFKKFLTDEDSEQVGHMLRILGSDDEMSDKLKEIGKLVAVSGYLVGKFSAFLDNLKTKRDKLRSDLYKKFRKQRQDSGDKVTEGVLSSDIDSDDSFVDLRGQSVIVQELVNILDSIREAARASQFAWSHVLKSELETEKSYNS